ncbi:hypothetical protein [Streptomyces sp. t39]|uniref:hypothetical protein n=1 Tax=Streptomyces sp. t39 TaxID=1828156 RepID=UPI0011CEA9DC|nr:hypothetical protein [Streptomyces sp. t39]TXS35240.1 hypothetical protein EAO77_37330 [Streptomyces sp. t39]
MDVLEASIAGLAAVFSAVAAVAAWRAAVTADRNARTANETADSARQTAEVVALIERDRRHTELTPRVFLYLTTQQGQGWVDLVVRYDGPSALGRLDRLELEVQPTATAATRFFLPGA